MAEPTTDEVSEVFQHWVATCRSSGKGRKPILGDKRRRKIQQAIKLYGLDACKDAIRGVTYSSWHMGHNPQGKKYDDIELILREEKHIEMFLELADERDSDFDTLEAYANGAEPF